MELVITDPGVVPTSQTVLTRFLARFVNDKRDVPVLRMMTITFITMLCSTFFVFAHFTWWTVAIHAVLFVFLMGPHTIALHLVSHRRFFQRQYAWLEYPLVHGLGMIFGHTPRSYFSHHIGMHHVEGGLEPDTSCTHHFRRDSVFDFTRYVLRFLTIGFIELARYLRMKKMDHLRRDLIRGDLVFWLIVICCAVFHWKATIVVFIASVVYTRFLMMAGNWGQHSLVDPSSPDNVYRNTITCINGFYNKWCFNDGYHISHHIHPTMHWTEHPNSFKKNVDSYVKHSAIVFHTIDFFGVWLLLMTKQYRLLARYYVQLGTQHMSTDDVVRLIRSRTVVIPRKATPVA